MMASNTDASKCMRIVYYNMHRFFQGFSAVKDLIANDPPDVIMLQKHWLTQTVCW